METRSGGAEVLFFTTPHCPTCKAIRPAADQVATRFGGTVRFREVDSTLDPDSSSFHRVRGVPTIVALHDGVEVGRVVGIRSEVQLMSLFDAARTGEPTRGLLSPTDRAMRLGVAAVFAGAAVVTATPVLWLFAGAAAAFGSWDLIRR